LIEPLRTSPAANTPGMLVSKRYGSRESHSRWSRCLPRAQSALTLPCWGETIFAEFYGTLEPAGVGIRTDEDKEGTTSFCPSGSPPSPEQSLDSEGSVRVSSVRWADQLSAHSSGDR
jgi:hypothetical protein